MSEPTAPGPRFNPEALYLALDKRRRERRISWRAIAGEAGVGIFTGPRLGRGQDVHSDTLVRLMVWLGETDLTPYMSSADEAKTARGEYRS